MNTQPVGIGLVGAGAYGEFCLAAFAEMVEVRIAAVCDTDSGRAERFAAQYGARAYTDLDALLQDPAVEIVALNTPPFLHGVQGLAVLNAGKHLFCEKPLALTLADGEALRAAAVRHNLRLSIDYVMRQNPLWRSVVALRQSGLLGKLLHMSLTNHAAGLNLPAQHWFWDKAQSGGIWIEHGVHFFDAFAWVAGTTGRITGAQRFINQRGQEDRVAALATYGDIAADFYHGFTHSSATERTTARLTFERGFVTLHEWVPTLMEIDAVPTKQVEALRSLLEGAFHAAPQANDLAALTVRLPEGKSAVYRACIQDGVRDLAHAVRHAQAELQVTVEHGLASLHMAVEADRIAGENNRSSRSFMA